MRIALFIQSLSGGGVERSSVRLARRFIDLGHEVDIVAFSGAGEMRDEAEKAARVVDLQAPWWIERLFKYLRYLYAEDPDVVIAATPGPNMLSSFVNGILSPYRPLIISERAWDGNLFGQETRWRARILQKLTRFAYRRAPAIVAVSRGIGARVAQLPKLKCDRVHVIYNPVWSEDIEKLSKLSPSFDEIYKYKGPIVLSVGRLSSEKDFSTLIRAFAEVRQRRHVRLLLLGEGYMREELEGLVKELGVADDVFMPGYVANPFAHMARANVFVLTSISEGFGNVLVEAMGCGTPIVSTNCPSGPAEILEGGKYGALVPVADASAIARAIEDQLDSPMPSDQLRQRARQFSVEASASAYLDVVSSLRK